MRPGILLNHSLSNGLLPLGKAACVPSHYPTGTIPKMFTCSVIVDIDAGGKCRLDPRAKEVRAGFPGGKAGSARAPPLGERASCSALG